MGLIDRISTIVVTATLTSAVWIVAGSSLMESATGAVQRATMHSTEGAASAPSRRETAAAQGWTSGDAAGTNRNLLIPVLNVRPADLADTFIQARDDGARLHEALDIMAPTGATVQAAGPGRIEKLHRSPAGGNTIYVRSGDGTMIHYYAHLEQYASGLREGQQINRGQPLGTVGSSGNADRDAPHLHFAILQTTADAEWWEPANAINPYPFLSGR